MPDATFEDFCALAGKVIAGEHPIMPQPDWGQDAAYVAFVIDSLRTENHQMRRLLDALVQTGIKQGTRDGHKDIAKLLVDAMLFLDGNQDACVPAIDFHVNPHRGCILR